MADKRISQLVERVNIANNDVLPIVASGATTTNKVTVSTLQDWMQSNLDVGVTSVGLSMPSAFVVSNSPVTGSGNISVTGAGTVSQYIRGDGSLADFPSGGGGGGSSVNYYLNGSVSQGTIGGIAYQEMNKVPVLGAGTDFTIAADGYIASFITDAGDPALLQIPAGNWNFETYLQASSGGGTPSFYIELYKVNSGGTATLIASNSATPELIAFGTTTTPYFSALAVPTTSLALTDRLALRYYVTHSGRTITLHTENATLCQIITTFTTGLTALNGLTAQVQNFATGTSGTDFAISSSVNTHTFNLPNASATARGVVSTGSQTFAGAKTFNSDIIVNGITVGKGGASNGNNTAIGANSLSSNTTGTLNTATGLSALAFNTAGNSNTANGANSLVANTTGGFNTAIGSQSLYSNTTGQANTAIGLNSLYSNTTGTYNTGVGSGAGYYIADGSTPNTTSDFSIYLGADTKASVDNAQNEVVIGYNAIGSGSNTVTIGNSSVTDNYFTGTIRSTSLRLAAAGTADTTIFRNTSGTSSSTGSANVVGFNGSNNIFVTTNSKGGFLLDFNNSVSNRTYTLQDASGTLAFTSQIPTNPVGGTGAAGRVAYWNGAGTITSDSLFQWNDTFKRLGIGRTPTVSLDVEGAGFFSTSVTSQVSNISADGAGVVLQGYVDNNLRIAVRGSGYNSGARGGLLASTGDFSSSVTAVNAVLGNTSNNTNAIQFLDASSSKGHIGSGFGATFINNNSFFNGSAYVFDDNTKPNSQITLSAGTVVLSTGAANVDPSAKVTILNNGNVGIGTALPQSWTRLEVAGTAGAQTDAAQQVIISAPTTTIGHGAGLRFNAASGAKEAVGIVGMVNEASGNLGAMTFHTYGGGANVPERMRITSGGNVELKRTISVGLDLSATQYVIISENQIQRTGNGTLFINNSANGDVSININGGGTFVNGTNGYGRAVTNSSDIRIKKNIEKIDGALNKVLQMNGVYYEFDSENELKINVPSGTTRIGLVAQEIESILPEAVFSSENELEPKSIDYSGMIGLLINAIQEQQAQIDSLKNQIK